jgi:hypothetical protein
MVLIRLTNYKVPAGLEARGFPIGAQYYNLSISLREGTIPRYL